jgi:hypothetical protein
VTGKLAGGGFQENLIAVAVRGRDVVDASGAGRSVNRLDNNQFYNSVDRPKEPYWLKSSGIPWPTRSQTMPNPSRMEVLAATEDVTGQSVAKVGRPGESEPGPQIFVVPIVIASTAVGWTGPVKGNQRVCVRCDSL